MKIKICGVTNMQDALLAESLGADYIGLIFTEKSKRRVSIEAAKEIAGALTIAHPIGLFVEQSMREVKSIAKKVGLYGVQVHKPIDKPIAHLMTIEVILLGDDYAMDRLEESKADFILFDAVKAGQFGGQGLQFDWSQLPKDRSRVFLAGGINPENVAEAVQQKCYSIDLCSGVEAFPGEKDPKKLTCLFENFEKGLRDE